MTRRRLCVRSMHDIGSSLNFCLAGGDEIPEIETRSYVAASEPLGQRNSYRLVNTLNKQHHLNLTQQYYPASCDTSQGDIQSIGDGYTKGIQAQT
jgi:hypothetical protein